MKALVNLEQAGYAIRLDGEQIRLSYQGQGKPDPSAVKPLMEDLKEHKDEALMVLRERETSRIFLEAMHELSAAWVPGLLEHTRRHHADIMEIIQQAEETLERSWVLTLKGKLTLADFEETVTTWRDAYRLTIHEHRAHGCEECEVGKRMECASSWSERRQS